MTLQADAFAKLDADVREATAFKGWADMKVSLDRGYVPTLKGRTEAERNLIESLKTLGYKVWGNNGQNW